MGKHGGVAKLLRQDVPHLINIHCLGHRLELAAFDTINAHEKMKRVTILNVILFNFLLNFDTNVTYCR